MASDRVFFDTDVIVNWLSKELETTTGRNLWSAPYKILNLIENGKLKGFISLTTVMELRFLLKRAKRYSSKRIEKDIGRIISIFELVIPDAIDMLKASSLQTEYPLDPFDSIHLSMCLSLKPVVLISRDNSFLEIAKKLISANTPEDFLSINRF